MRQSADRPAARHAPLVLAVALAGISFGGPLVRLSHAHPLAIAIWRVGLSLIFVAAGLIASGSWRQLRALGARDVGVAFAAGAMLAIHFWSWNASLAFTSVAASVLLVNTQPIVVAILSALWLREPASRTQWMGIVVAMTGAAVVVLPELTHVSAHVSAAASGGALFGDALALIGAVTGACYYVAGRRLRATLDLWPYVAVVYGACFGVLIALAAGTGAPVIDQPTREIAIFAGLAVGPMMLGHTGFNWALRYLPAFVVNLTALGEPVGAAILAAMLPGIREVPSPATLAGGAVVLAGVVQAARGASHRLQRAD